MAANTNNNMVRFVELSPAYVNEHISSGENCSTCIQPLNQRGVGVAGHLATDQNGRLLKNSDNTPKYVHIQHSSCILQATQHNLTQCALCNLPIENAQNLSLPSNRLDRAYQIARTLPGSGSDEQSHSRLGTTEHSRLARAIDIHGSLPLENKQWTYQAVLGVVRQLETIRQDIVSNPDPYNHVEDMDALLKEKRVQLSLFVCEDGVYKYEPLHFLIKRELLSDFAPSFAIFGGIAGMGVSFYTAYAAGASENMQYASIGAGFACSLVGSTIPLLGFAGWDQEATWRGWPSLHDLENHLGRISKRTKEVFQYFAYPAIGAGIILCGTYTGKVIGEVLLNHMDAPQMELGLQAGLDLTTTIVKVVGTLSFFGSLGLYMKNAN